MKKLLANKKQLPRNLFIKVQMLQMPTQSFFRGQRRGHMRYCLTYCSLPTVTELVVNLVASVCWFVWPFLFEPFDLEPWPRLGWDCRSRLLVKINTCCLWPGLEVKVKVKSFACSIRYYGLGLQCGRGELPPTSVQLMFIAGQRYLCCSQGV